MNQSTLPKRLQELATKIGIKRKDPAVKTEQEPPSKRRIVELSDINPMLNSTPQSNDLNTVVKSILRKQKEKNHFRIYLQRMDANS